MDEWQKVLAYAWKKVLAWDIEIEQMDVPAFSRLRTPILEDSAF